MKEDVFRLNFPRSGKNIAARRPFWLVLQTNDTIRQYSIRRPTPFYGVTIAINKFSGTRLMD
jgi:hypothetical protein